MSLPLPTEIPPETITEPTSEIRRKVNTLLSEGFEISMEKLTPNATLFQELGLDSLDAVDMLVHLEESFKIKVDGERLMTVRTVQDIYNLVAEVASKAPANAEN